MIIRDAVTGKPASVTTEELLRTFAVGMSRLSYVSQLYGRAYSWSSDTYDYAALDTILWLRNDDPNRYLIVDQLYVSSDASTEVIVHCPVSTTQVGTAITGVNLNRASSNVALATAIRDETANSQANVIWRGLYLASTSFELLNGADIVLGYLDEIGVDLTTVGTACDATIFGYYEEHD